ncbi:Alpha/beta hydrolase family protein [Falsiruegeria litorea R37]|uniref:Alpha/beta hydrolase family protein n=1 Tax=Falsiruegeria litorea R37 TaxID=1200284 RepID=A0A1Y5TCC3_9RHOB|nr:Alpha/beta hydrolase family protein [Falsiruegeria litorea R37]
MKHAGEITRDQVIAAIYETVLRPELYEAFMQAWEEHITQILSEPQVASHLDGRDVQGGMEIDPELQAHFARAHDILNQIGRKVPRTALQDRIASVDGFALLATTDGRIIALGKGAGAFFDQRTSIDALNDRLTAGSVTMLEELRRAAHQADGGSDAVVLTTDATPRHLIARIVDDNGEARLVIEGLDYRWTGEAEQLLVTSFGLSKAEVDVVRNLMAGRSLREMAALSGRSEHTVRNQAKSVLSKTGAPGQVDLIRLVAFLVGSEGPSMASHPGAVELHSELRSMDTGLQMQLFQCGDPNGQPVIYLHGMLDGMAPLHHLQTQGSLRGYRVIAPVRPGYGQSETVSSPEEALNSGVAHINELIACMGLEQPVILGHMAGALHGHVACSSLHGRVKGMVAVAGGGPVLRMKQISKMAPRQRVMAYTARFAPALLPFFVRAGIALVDSDDVPKFMDTLYKPGSHERQVVDRLDLAELMYAGYRFAAQAGAAGFTSDGHLMVRNWLAMIQGSTTPVLHLHGALDPVIPACATERFVGEHDNMSMRLFRDAGQFLIYERPEAVLAAIDDLVAFDGQDAQVLALGA